MSKLIHSPIERFKGSVTIADPLYQSHAHIINQSIEDVDFDGESGLNKLTVISDRQLPVIFACVEKWDLQNIPQNVTAENFPYSPRIDSHKLINWIYGEIFKVFMGELEIPKE